MISTCKNEILPKIKEGLKLNKIKGTITLSGYEGSELLVARLLTESGAKIPYVGTHVQRLNGQKRQGMVRVKRGHG